MESSFIGCGRETEHEADGSRFRIHTSAQDTQQHERPHRQIHPFHDKHDRRSPYSAGGRRAVTVTQQPGVGEVIQWEGTDPETLISRFVMSRKESYISGCGERSLKAKRRDTSSCPPTVTPSPKNCSQHNVGTVQSQDCGFSKAS